MERLRPCPLNSLPDGVNAAQLSHGDREAARYIHIQVCVLFTLFHFTLFLGSIQILVETQVDYFYSKRIKNTSKRFWLEEEEKTNEKIIKKLTSLPSVLL